MLNIFKYLSIVRLHFNLHWYSLNTTVQVCWKTKMSCIFQITFSQELFLIGWKTKITRNNLLKMAVLRQYFGIVVILIVMNVKFYENSFLILVAFKKWLKCGKPYCALSLFSFWSFNSQTAIHECINSCK